jgi:hypothetical protein
VETFCAGERTEASSPPTARSAAAADLVSNIVIRQLGEAVSIVDSFIAAYTTGSLGSADPALIPSRLAQAVTAVMPVHGVGISLFDSAGMRVPVGASSAAGTQAEHLQFTVGQGPCLDAHLTGLPVIATEAVIARRWPIYHDGMVESTPFRSVIALPLTGPRHAMATMDLLFHDPLSAMNVELDGIHGPSRHMSAVLTGSDLFKRAAGQARVAAQSQQYRAVSRDDRHRHDHRPNGRPCARRTGDPARPRLRQRHHRR